MTTPTPSPSSPYSLESLVERGDLGGLSSILSHSPVPTERLHPLLFLCALHDRADCLSLLLRHVPAAALTTPNASGATLLKVASSAGHVRVVEVILSALPRGGVDATSKGGWTALMAAAGKGHLAVVETLLAHKPMLEAPQPGAWTALMVTCREGHVAVCQRLIKAGALVNSCTAQGATALMVASQYNQLECVRALLVSGADVNARDASGTTALMLAADGACHEVVQVLLASGADRTLKNDSGWTALSLGEANSGAKNKDDASRTCSLLREEPVMMARATPRAARQSAQLSETEETLSDDDESAAAKAHLPVHVLDRSGLEKRIKWLDSHYRQAMLRLKQGSILLEKLLKELDEYKQGKSDVAEMARLKDRNQKLEAEVVRLLEEVARLRGKSKV